MVEIFVYFNEEPHTKMSHYAELYKYLKNPKI